MDTRQNDVTLQCPRCGQPLPAGPLACPACGTKFDSSAVGQPVIRRGRGFYIAVWIILAGIGLCAVAGTAIALMSAFGIIK